MSGRDAKSSVNEAPPAYSSSSSPDAQPLGRYLTQMTTRTETVVTRTTTITTFLPGLSRKRSESRKGEERLPPLEKKSPNPPSNGPFPPTPTTPSFTINKALPAIPDDLVLSSSTDLYRGRSEIANGSGTRLSSSRSGISLAQAALVGITPLLPAANAKLLSPITTEGTSEAAENTGKPIAEPNKPTNLRHGVLNGLGTVLRRRRGLSVGPSDRPSTMAHKSIPPESGKSPKREPGDIHSPPVRRPSLWRIRVSSLSKSDHPPTEASAVSLLPLPHTLPILRPSSPLLGPHPYPPNSTAARTEHQGHQEGLIRRHSARESYSRPNGRTVSGNSNVEPRSAGVERSAAALDIIPQLRRRRSLSFRRIEKSHLPDQKCRPRSQSEVFPPTLREKPVMAQAPSAIQRGTPTVSSYSSNVIVTSRPATLASTPGDLWTILEPHSVQNTDVAGENVSPEAYLQRLVSCVSQLEIATVLASSGDALHASALRVYMNHFDFTDEAIDISLRRFLMESVLPKETQQIDRVINAFAQRYQQCNPHVFVADDHAYIIAFSLIMLHTDAFNRSNKYKMTRGDYVKNTQLSGVPSNFLEYLYDNVLFAPFILIEDPVDVNGQRGLAAGPRHYTGRFSTFRDINEGTVALSTLHKARTGKIDPYHMIVNNLLGPLRLAIDEHIPPFNPYLYEGTLGAWDEAELRKAFANAARFEMVARRPLAEHPSLSPAPSLRGPGGLMSSNPVGAVDISPIESSLTSSDASNLKIAKIGHLDRKEDILESGKRSSSRRWKEWVVILTGSQLLFFRDATWALGLIPEQIARNDLLIPPTALLRPDEIISLKDAIAVCDLTYTKHSNTLRCVLPTGRQFFLRAKEEHEINDWIHLINYASAFRTAGIRMRAPSGVSGGSTLSSAAPAASGDHWTLENCKFDDEKSADSSETCPSPTAEALKIPFPFGGSDNGDSNDVTLGRPLITGNELIAQVDRSRKQFIEAKTAKLSSKIIMAEQQLQSYMRSTRIYSLLTPFQKNVKYKLQSCVLALAKKVQTLRIELCKLRCHHQILTSDLQSMESEAVVRGRLLSGAALVVPSDERREACHDSHGPHLSSEALSADVDRGSAGDDSTRQSADAEEWEGLDGEAEIDEAEDWLKTRAGKRVSLVRVPSNMGLRPEHRQLDDEGQPPGVSW